jgi:hypothetical protein
MSIFTIARFLPYGFALVAVGYLYYLWNGMEKTIHNQSEIIESQSTTISVMAENIETMKIDFKDEIKKVAFESKSKEKKEHIEKDINYDKENSNNIDSTRFYLSF